MCCGRDFYDKSDDGEMGLPKFDVFAAQNKWNIHIG